MNANQHGFKNEILDTIYFIANCTWLKITGANAIVTGTTIIIYALLAFAGFSSTIFSDINFSTQQVWKNIFNDFQLNAINASLIASLVIVFIIMILLSAWNYYFALLLTNKQIVDDSAEFNEIFSKSLNKGILKIIGVTFLVYLIIFFGAMIIAVIFLKVSKVIGILFIPVLLLFLIRLVLIVPAFIIGNMSLSDSVVFSIKKISWRKSLEIFAIIVIAFIVLIIISLIAGLVLLVFKFIPVVGQAAQLIFQVFLSGIITAYSMAAILGLYYQNIGDIDASSEDIEFDDLLVRDN